MGLRDLFERAKEGIKEKAKKAVKMAVLGTVALTAVTGAYAGEYHQVEVTNPQCAQVLNQIDYAQILKERYQHALELAKKTHGYLRERHIAQALEAKQELAQVMNQLLENGKYNKVEVAVDNQGHCQITKWNGIVGEVENHGFNGKAVAYEEVSVKDGINFKESLNKGVALKVEAVQGLTGKTTNLQDKLNDYVKQKESQAQKAKVTQGKDMVNPMMF